MARHYDRLIRYYDSWFDDLKDPDKELSGDECWLVMLAIRDAQQLSSTEPLRNLPLSVRRALSMSTLIEQVERIIEKCDTMRQRGRLGGNTAARNAQTITDLPDVDISTLSPPEDGRERHFDSLVKTLRAWKVPDSVIYDAIMWSDFGLHGHQVWRFIYRAQTRSNPGFYFESCMQRR